jgi:hypothetical protein
MTLWIHMGLPKTGTSALQVFFARNHAGLGRKGVAYPWPHPKAQRGGVTTGNAAWLAMSPDGFPADDRSDELRRLLASGNVVLSSEYFSGTSAATLNALRDEAGDLRLLIYLREHADMALAHYTTVLGSKRWAEKPAFPDFAKFYLNFPYMTFSSRLEELESIVGPQNLAVRSYKQNRERLPESAVDWLGLTADGLDTSLAAVNRSAGRHTRAYPEVLADIRRSRADDLETVVRKWFPGQGIEDVFDFPDH